MDLSVEDFDDFTVPCDLIANYGGTSGFGQLYFGEDDQGQPTATSASIPNTSSILLADSLANTQHQHLNNYFESASTSCCSATLEVDRSTISHGLVSPPLAASGDTLAWGSSTHAGVDQHHANSILYGDGSVDLPYLQFENANAAFMATASNYMNDYSHSTVSPADLQSVNSDETAAGGFPLVPRRRDKRSTSVSTVDSDSPLKRARVNAGVPSASSLIAATVGRRSLQRCVFVEGERVGSSLVYHLSLSCPESSGVAACSSEMMSPPISPLLPYSMMIDCDIPPVSLKALSQYIGAYQGHSSEYPDSKLALYTPRIGQKSYGTEKRLFCPPPMVHFSGREWFCQPAKTDDDGAVQLKSREVTLSIDTSGIRNFSMCGGSGSFTSLTNYRKCPLSLPHFMRYLSSVAMFKSMFIGDLAKLREMQPDCGLFLRHPRLAQLYLAGGSQKTKSFELYLRISDFVEKLSDGRLHVGTFKSDTMHLISKPSKKKGPSKPQLTERRGSRSENAGASEIIFCGDSIAIYNRLKSQTVSTKYCCLDMGEDNSVSLFARGSMWQSFVIRSLDRGDMTELTGPILYDAILYLECLRTNWKSEPFYVRRVDTKEHIVLSSNPLDCDERLLQLQKVCFQSCKNPDLFLGIDGGDLGKIAYLRATKVDRKTRNDDDPSPSTGHRVSEQCIFSLVSVSCTSYRYYRPVSISESKLSPLPVSPVPKLALSEFRDELLQCRYNIDGHHALSISIDLDASALLETLDALMLRLDRNTPLFIALSQHLHFDVYVGNVFCSPLQIATSFLTERGRSIGPAELLDRNSANLCGDDSLTVYSMQLLVKLPTLDNCIKLGKWQKNVDFISAKTSHLPTPFSAFESDPSATEWSRFFRASDRASGSSDIMGLPADHHSHLDETLGKFGLPPKLCSHSIQPPDSEVSNCSNPIHKHYQLSRQPWKKLGTVTAPIILVRKTDGVVYKTETDVTFAMEIV